MRFPDITKFQGFLLSIPCIAFYWYLFHLYNTYYFDSVPSLDTLNGKVFLLGATIHMMYVIPAGETATVTFGAKSRDQFWSDGVVFVPNILHFTISAFNFAILWGIALVGATYQAGRSYVNAEVFTHQMLPTYTRTTHMSKIGADVDRAANAFLFWLFGWRNGEPHLVLMRFGFRLMVIAYIWATLTGVFDQGQRQVSRVVDSTTNAIHSTINDFAQNYTPPDSLAREMYTRVSVQLDVGPKPKWPGWEVFTPTHEEGMQYHDMVEEKKYFIYSEPSSGSVDTIHITESSCAAIPVGRHVYFSTDIPPAYVVNMNDEVEFLEKRFGFTLGDPFDAYLLEFKKKDWGGMCERTGIG